MFDENGNSAVTVKKSELVATMRTNLAKHREIFLEAQEGYRKAAVALLEEMLAEARAGKRVRRTVALVEPMDQSRDYERVLRMLEMSVAEEVKISETEFSQYVMDDWSWKGQFITTSQAYGART